MITACVIIYNTQAGPKHLFAGVTPTQFSNVICCALKTYVGESVPLVFLSTIAC